MKSFHEMSSSEVASDLSLVHDLCCFYVQMEKAFAETSINETLEKGMGENWNNLNEATFDRINRAMMGDVDITAHKTVTLNGKVRKVILTEEQLACHHKAAWHYANGGQLMLDGPGSVTNRIASLPSFETDVCYLIGDMK